MLTFTSRQNSEMEESSGPDLMDIYESILERNRHESEPLSCGALEYHDLEAAEALVCMSSWGQRSHKPRPDPHVGLLRLPPAAPHRPHGAPEGLRLPLVTVHDPASQPQFQREPPPPP
ncbi:hypothetical protein AAFF_G00222860 [Aldrovandia affinis]|uniref:Uncharacterized protein n=1 Tax=Aldrovandia affinis TaxID=143900 RepID=A0AAD7RFC6_9TELE|nr:hypothetical protein AAFF_G00222860 [Aldrovandia affinis]